MKMNYKLYTAYYCPECSSQDLTELFNLPRNFVICNECGWIGGLRDLIKEEMVKAINDLII